jgi:hypothetical protein
MTAIAQRRVAGATAIMILLYLLQVALFAPSAGAQGNPPSVECASELWNGKYYKVQVNNGSLGNSEGTGIIDITGVPGDGTWENGDTDTVFRVLYKVGQGVGVDQEFNDSWAPGEGDDLLNPNGLSHITWCFTAPSTTTTEATTTTTTEATTTTTTQPTTTTTQPTTTTTQPVTTTTQPVTTTTEATTTTTEAEVLGTTITTVPEVSAETLPFTGFEAGDTARLGLLAILAGGLMLFAVRGKRDEEVASTDIGGWSNL